MKGYTIQHSIELLEKSQGSGGGASIASAVSFDNTGTGLVATNVQSAISEVNGKSIDLFPSDSSEHSLGGGVYVKKFSGESITDGQVLMENVTGHLVGALGYTTGAISGTPTNYPINYHLSDQWDSKVLQNGTNIQLYAGSNLRGAYEIWVYYTKPATRTRKSK